MQEIKKRRIVLASILKPVDDARMSEKLGATLASGYEVIIIGQPSNYSTNFDNVQYSSLPGFSRLSYKRLVAPLRVLRRVLVLRPAMLIVCTAELLPVALCTRMFTGATIVYDIQENYTQNIMHGRVWPRLIKPLLAFGVRLLEGISSVFIRHFLLAEQSYAEELKFIGRRFTVIENKAKRRAPAPATAALPDQRRPIVSGDYAEIRLLFSGTLADTTGIWKAIEIAGCLHSIQPLVRLYVVGYAAQKHVRKRLRELAHQHPFISLVGIDHLVPHEEIVRAIHEAHFGIVAYPPNQSTWHSYPTKLYEYLGACLPILLIDNPRWVALCAPYGAAVVFNAESPIDPLSLWERIQGSFYSMAPANVYWEEEGVRLLQTIGSILEV